MATGHLGPGGNWVTPPDQPAQSGLINRGSAGLSAVTYNGSNQVTGFAFAGVTYTVTYPTGEIVVTGDDDSVQTISLDGSGRIEAVA